MAAAWLFAPAAATTVVAAAASSTAASEVGLPSPMPTPPAPNEEEVAGLVDQTAMQEMVRSLVAFGNRFGGSVSNELVANYIALQFQEAGYTAHFEEAPEAPTYDLVAHGLAVEAPKDAGVEFKSAWPYGFSPSLDVVAPVVYIGKGDTDAAAAPAKGKIALMDASPRKFGPIVAKAGAIAIITDAPDTAGMYENAANVASLDVKDESRLSVMAISRSEGQALKAILQKGEVAVHFKVQTNIFQGKPITTIAELPGLSTAPELLVTAHGDGDSGGPSADDNASGIAGVLEVARVLKLAQEKGLWSPAVSVKFLAIGKEIYSTRAWIAQHPDELAKIAGVLNFDEIGAGASRDAVFYESPDVPYNELLIRTLDSVGRDYVGKDGFWKEYNTDVSLGGTDAYAFLGNWTAAGYGSFGGSEQIPATTIFTAAWNSADEVDQAPFWPNKGLAPGAKVVVDYSEVYHSSGDVPENTTDAEPFNMTNSVKSTVLAILRLNAEYQAKAPFSDLGLNPNRRYAIALAAKGVFAGFPDGTAKLDEPATVKELIQWVGALAGDEKADAAAASLGSGESDASNAVTRLLFAKALTAATAGAATSAPGAADALGYLKSLKLSDAGSLATGDAPAVATALQDGWLLPEYKERKPFFNGGGVLNRGEVLKRLYWVLVWAP